MDKLKVAFVDFWPEFAEENIFLPLLQKHFDVEITNNEPDVAIHSVFGNPRQVSRFKCKKILFLGENHRAATNRFDYSISFDPVDDKNFRLPLWQFYLILRPELIDKLLNRSNNSKEFDKFCSFTVSNPSNFFRNAAFDQLNQYKKMSSYGRFKTNDLKLIQYSQGKYWRDAKYNFFVQHKHKFALNCEHSSYPGYCTEKLMDGFLGGSLPIYWGDPTIKTEWNEKAFINIMNLGSSWFDLVKKIDNDDKLFEEYYNQPVFTVEQKQKFLDNIQQFEEWLIKIIKE